ncbi:MAG: succinic semialdehyde dehydrogenase [Halobacteriales archaeon]
MTSPPVGYDGPSLGSLVADIDADSDDTLSVISPLTGDPVGDVPAYTPAGVRDAVARARTAQTAWADRPIADRVAMIERFLDRVSQHREEILDLVQLESGKTRYDATEELLDVQATGSYYASTAADHLAVDRHHGAIPLLTSVTEHHHPLGVVGFITPWNYPLSLVISDALPALLAGNAVVIKPAEQTPYTALYVARLLRTTGIPEECIQIVPGRGSRLGSDLVRAVDCVSFTGSTAAGREVAAMAGEHLVPATLELGGAGPMLIRGDAPTERTVTGAVRGAYASAGQLCISVERIYVHESRYEAFCDRLVERVQGLDLGTNFGYDPDVGPLITPDHREKVAGHVEDAVERGATVLAGGCKRDDVAPTAYEPTVLTDVPEDALVATEETFGPVVTVTPVPDDETAVQRANDSRYGLHGSIWTRDRETGGELASRVDCGTICVNDAYVSMWGSTAAPMGGRKESGLGRRHGREGIVKYTDTQSVVTQRGHPLSPPSNVPNRMSAGGLSAYVRLLGWLRRRLR